MLTRRSCLLLPLWRNSSFCSRSLSHASIKEKFQRLSSMTSNVWQHFPITPASDSTTKFYESVKGTLLEMMARNMSASDREFLLRQWGQNIANVENNAVMSTAEEDTKSIEENIEALDTTSVENLVEEQCSPLSSMSSELHPIFGQMLVDMGYKQVYLTSARRLALAHVWQKQRTLRPERSEGIANVKRNSTTGLPGIITLFRDAGSDTVGIVDGQHRVGALLLLMRDNAWQADELNILIEVYTFQDSISNEVENLFTEINSAEPVKAIDMPTENGDDDIKIIINEAVKVLVDKNPAMFKPTNRCRAPHLHADTLREDLYSSEYIIRKGLKSVDEVITHFEKLNTDLSQQELGYWGYTGKKDKGQDAKLNAITKAMNNKFYIGLSKRWLHE